MSSSGKRFYAFESFRLDPEKRQLLDGAEPVALSSKAFEILSVLLENRGKVLTKDDLMRRVWPDTIVEEANLSVNISQLRKALGESPSEHRYIVTVPGVGYQFVADVSVVENGTGKLEAVVEAAPAQAPDRRRVWIALAVMGAIAFAAGWLWRSGGLTRQPKTVAVLPFGPLGADGNDEYLGLGVADSLITRLGKMSDIVVRPTSAVRRFAGTARDPLGAGKQLGVEAVLDGTLQRSGDRIRVTARLLRVDDGASLWADTFDEKFTDIFAVEDSISEKVAQAMAARLSGQERKLLKRHGTENAAAYELYLKGRYYWNRRTPESLKRGCSFFQQAIETDPAYSDAYAGLADSYSLLAIQEVLAPREAFPMARGAAQRALELDGDSAVARASLAHIRLHEWDWRGAEKDFQEAIRLSPNYAVAHHWYAEYLSATKRPAEALAEERRARDLDPLSLVINTDLGWQLYFARRYDEAVERLRATLDLDPSFPMARLRLGQVYEQRGDQDAALREILRARELAPESVEALAALAHCYGKFGRRSDALRVLEEIKAREDAGRSPYFLAYAYLGLGDAEQALAQLERAVDERSGWLVFLRVEPRFDPLRAQPRFSEVLRRVGLAP